MARPASTQEEMRRLDRDNGGKIDADEFAALDRNRDGNIDADDVGGKKKPVSINVNKLQHRLAYEEEARGACCAACSFLFFSCIYIIVLDMQFQTEHAFEISQALKDYVNDIDAGEPVRDFRLICLYVLR